MVKRKTMLTMDTINTSPQPVQYWTMCPLKCVNNAHNHPAGRRPYISSSYGKWTQ